jgi:hypothetical protein
MTPEPFLDAFAQAIVARAFGRAEAMLAPWIRNALPTGGLKDVVRLTLADNPPVSEFLVTALPYSDLGTMRESVEENAADDDGRTLETTDGTGALHGPPSFPIPDKLTDENFLGCWRIEFQPDEDLETDVDYSFALYVAVVAVGDECEVGYIEPMD